MENRILKRVIAYTVIIVPIIVVAIKWHVWDSGIGGLVLAFVALFNCTIWENINNEQDKKEGTE